MSKGKRGGKAMKEKIDTTFFDAVRRGGVQYYHVFK